MRCQVMQRPITHKLVLRCGLYLYINLLGECMKKVLGKVSKEIAENWNIDEHKNKKIVIYEEAIKHSMERHIDDYYYVMNSLEKIINNPDYVFYDKSKKGLEYYKQLKSDILVAVRVNNSKELKVKSVYPVKKSKIENRKKKEEEIKLYNKYVVCIN